MSDISAIIAQLPPGTDVFGFLSQMIVESVSRWTETWQCIVQPDVAFAGLSGLRARVRGSCLPVRFIFALAVPTGCTRSGADTLFRVLSCPGRVTALSSLVLVLVAAGFYVRWRKGRLHFFVADGMY